MGKNKIDVVLKNLKLGQGKRIYKAKIASNLTSKELISDSAPDAYFFRSLEKQGIFLNENQIKAVRHMEGPCLIMAGAGSGKTRVLTARTAYLLTYNEEIKPHNIMLVTFTRKAADEMKERVQMLPDISAKMASEIKVGTFHSIFLNLLRKNGFEQKILSNDRYKEFIIKGILKKMGLKDAYEPEDILSKISSYKSNLQRPHQVKAQTPIEREVKEIYAKYMEILKDENYIDFDDILLESYDLLVNNVPLLEQVKATIKYIQVDEFQDVNFVQNELVRLIINDDEKNVFFVGDDDQVIYSFRDASPKFILGLEQEYKDLTIIELDTNYRSTDTIVGLGNEVIKRNKRRKGKTLLSTKLSEESPYFLEPEDSHDEAKQIVRNIIADIENGRTYRDFGILFRTHSNSRAIFDELVMRDIPFITKNEQTFYDQAIVKPVLDYLRLAVDENNLEALKGICASLYLNKEKVAQHIESYIKPNDSLLDCLVEMPDLKPFQHLKITERIRFIRQLQNFSPKVAIDQVRNGIPKYNDFLSMDERKTLTLQKEFILETLDELEIAAMPFKNVHEFIAFVEKVMNKNKELEKIRKQKDFNGVELLTIHTAKGLEYPVVYILGFNDGVIPHKASFNAGDQKDRVVDILASKEQIVSEAIEEERRLAYVSITRAEEELYISIPKKTGDKVLEISRFLKGIIN